MKVDIYAKGFNGEYSLLNTIQESYPLFDIAISPDADIFVVNRHTNHSSALYQYDECAGSFYLVDIIESEQDHCAVEMTDAEIVIGD